MDKYQTFILRQARTEIAFYGQGAIRVFSPVSDETPVFTQDWDLRKKDYIVAVLCNPKEDPGIEKVYAVFEDGEKEFSPVRGKYVKYPAPGAARFKMGLRLQREGEEFPGSLPDGTPNPYADREGTETEILGFPVSFAERMKSIRIVFRNNLADDLIVPVVYKPADAREFRERVAAVQCGTGPNGAAVFYRPCWKTYKYAEAEFFVVRKKKTAAEPAEYIQMTKRRNLDGDNFIALQGIPYGSYAVVLRQYDEKDTLLYETKKIPFNLREGQFETYTP